MGFRCVTTRAHYGQHGQHHITICDDVYCGYDTLTATHPLPSPRHPLFPNSSICLYAYIYMYMYCETTPCEIMCSRTSLGTPFAWPLQTSGQRRRRGENAYRSKSSRNTQPSRLYAERSYDTLIWMAWVEFFVHNQDDGQYRVLTLHLANAIYILSMWDIGVSQPERIMDSMVIII